MLNEFKLFRILIALAITPLIVPLSAICLAYIKGKYFSVLGVFLWYGSSAYIVAIFIGIPIIFIMQKFEINTLLHYLIVGFCLASFLGVLVNVFIGGGVEFFILAIVSTEIIAWLFWNIAFKSKRKQESHRDRHN